MKPVRGVARGLQSRARSVAVGSSSDGPLIAGHARGAPQASGWPPRGVCSHGDALRAVTCLMAPEETEVGDGRGPPVPAPFLPLGTIRPAEHEPPLGRNGPVLTRPLADQAVLRTCRGPSGLKDSSLRLSQTRLLRASSARAGGHPRPWTSMRYCESCRVSRWPLPCARRAGAQWCAPVCCPLPARPAGCHAAKRASRTLTAAGGPTKRRGHLAFISFCLRESVSCSRTPKRPVSSCLSFPKATSRGSPPAKLAASPSAPTHTLDPCGPGSSHARRGDLARPVFSVSRGPRSASSACVSACASRALPLRTAPARLVHAPRRRQASTVVL